MNECKSYKNPVDIKRVGWPLSEIVVVQVREVRAGSEGSYRLPDGRTNVRISLYKHIRRGDRNIWLHRNFAGKLTR